MARPLRLEYEGAVHHVTSRGNDRAAIFLDDRDRSQFLDFLGAVVTGQQWVLHAYCLMGNHYHLLLETPLANLSRGMQRLNGRYTQYFNRRHGRSGHLLQGRHKAILVEKQSHLLELTRYLVLNPVRARMVESAGRWPWSNYRATSGAARAPKWLEVDWTLSQFGARRAAASHRYRQFVSEGKGLPSPLRSVTGQIYLGGEAFLKEADARLKRQKLDSALPSTQRRPWATDVAAIKAAVAHDYGVPQEVLIRRRGAEHKKVAIYLARNLTNLGMAEIGRLFGVTAARVSQVTADLEKNRNRSLRQRIHTLRKRLGQPD